MDFRLVQQHTYPLPKLDDSHLLIRRFLSNRRVATRNFCDGLDDQRAAIFSPPPRDHGGIFFESCRRAFVDDVPSKQDVPVLDTFLFGDEL